MNLKELISAVFENISRGDWDGAEAFLSDDLVIYEPTSLPYGGEWKGRDALRRLYADVMGYWIDPQVEWLDLLVGEQHAAAYLRFTMTSRVTGERFVQTLSEVSRFQDGKIVEMRIHYFDSAEVARQAGGKPL